MMQFQTQKRRRYLILAALAAMAFALPARAEQTMPIRIIDGSIVLRCNIKAKGEEVPVHLVLDLGSSQGVILHSNTAKMLELGKKTTIDISWAGGSMENVLPRQWQLTQLEDFSKEFSEELEEIPAAGTMGLGAFENQIVQVDIGAGLIRFARPEDGGNGLFPAAGPGITIVDYEQGKSGPLLPGIKGKLDSVKVQYATVRHETVLNADLALQIFPEGKETPAFTVAGIDILPRGPVRIYEFDVLTDPQPQVILGTSFLSNVRLTLNTLTRKAAIESQAPTADVRADQAFFQALYHKDPAGLETYLKQQVSRRYVKEAAQTLLSLRLKAKDYDENAAKKAVAFYASTIHKDRRSQELIALADKWLGPDESTKLPLAEYALNLARKALGTDLNSAAVHNINARLGYIALLHKDYPTARRLLLAAAFGLPRDQITNLWLARLYRETGQLTRAWSRYLEVALTEQPPLDAFMGLDELNRDPKFREQFKISDAELMLEGWAPAFVPPEQRPAEELPNVRLAELFVNSDKSISLASQLAVHGFKQYFADTPVVVVQYHVDTILPSNASKERYAYYQLKGGSNFLYDGEVVTHEGGHAEGIAPDLFDDLLRYNKARKLPASNVTLATSAGIASGKIQTTIKVTSGEGSVPEGDLRLHVLLCEEAVFATSANGGFINYDVVRGRLTPAEGVRVLYQAREQTCELGTTMDDVHKQVEEAWAAAANPKIKWRMRPTLVDEKQCRLVMFVQDAKTKRVWAAATAPLQQKESN